MRPDTPQEYIGVDVGSVRVGLARGSSAARLAQPVKTVTASEAMDELKALAEELQATGIVVGLPRSLQGKDTSQTEYVRQWIAGAKNRIKLPFYTQDEALTSKIAERNGSREGAIDAQAAALILQDFLDTPEEERLSC